MPPRDEQLAAAVEAALGALPEVDLGNLHVRVARGVAHVEGVVASLLEKEAAARAARAVPGVRAVRNLLAVEEHRPATDRERSAALARALADDPLTDERLLGARSRGGRAELIGQPADARAVERAAEVAAGLPGVSEVVRGPDLTREAGDDPVDLANRVADALDAAPDLEGHAIRPLGEPEGVVRLVGHVADAGRRRQAEAAARGVAGVRRVINELEIAACGLPTAEAPPSPRTDGR